MAVSGGVLANNYRPVPNERKGPTDKYGQLQTAYEQEMGNKAGDAQRNAQGGQEFMSAVNGRANYDTSFTDANGRTMSY